MSIGMRLYEAGLHCAQNRERTFILLQTKIRYAQRTALPLTFVQAAVGQNKLRIRQMLTDQLSSG